MAAEAQRRGVGRALLAELVQRCTALGYRQMIAVIGDSANRGSIGVHEAAGFTAGGPAARRSASNSAAGSTA